MRSPVFDLYPLLRDQFENPDVTSIDLQVGQPPRLRRITRAEFEEERLMRDVLKLKGPMGPRPS